LTRWQAGGDAVVIAGSSVMVGFAKANLIGDHTMTDEMMTLRSLVEKAADADLLREMIGFAAERLMELEVGGLTGAAWGEKSAERLSRPSLGDPRRDGRATHPGTSSNTVKRPSSRTP
jgi:hypothetical protein